MKKRRLIIRTTILVLLIGALGYTLYSNFFMSKEKVKVGSKAPDFALIDLEGKKHQFSDYRGKGVFLNFWGTWCKPCEREMPYIERQYQHFKNHGVEVLAVNVGESELAVEKFAEQYDLHFPIVIDKDLQVLNAYGVDPLPTTFLIDKNGKVVKILTGSMTERDVSNYMEMIKP